MEKGNIAASIPRRILIEFEGLLAQPGDAKKRWFGKPRPSDWELDDLVVMIVNDLTFRYFVQVEVITRQGEDFAAELKDWLEQKHVFARDTWAYEARVLARDLLTMPHVVCVYTADTSHAMLYGSRGRMVTPDTVQQIGKL